MGFDILSHANNHATDWGAEGLAETLDHLDANKLVHAGTGATMTAARAPRYLDTAHGRIGLVAAATSFTPMSRAADPQGEVPGRPGVNAIRSIRAGVGLSGKSAHARGHRRQRSGQAGDVDGQSLYRPRRRAGEA